MRMNCDCEAYSVLDSTLAHAFVCVMCMVPYVFLCKSSEWMEEEVMWSVEYVFDKRQEAREKKSRRM